MLVIELVRKYDSFGLYKNIKEVPGVHKKINLNVTKDKVGKSILDIYDNLKRWEEYIKKTLPSPMRRNRCERTNERTAYYEK